MGVIKMKNMRPDTFRLLNFVQLVLEVCIAAGYLLSMVPFLYAMSSSWVVPMTIISAILAFVSGNATRNFALGNIVMSLLGFIPLIGYVPRIIGGILSLVNIAIIRRSI
jgi:uncharacterized membrane protein